MKNKKYKYNKKIDEDTYDEYSNSSNNQYEISESDIKTLELLRLQILVIYMSIYGYIILYTAVLEGIQLIFSQTNSDNIDNISSADEKALRAVYLFFIIQIISTGISISRYNILNKRKQNKEINFSLVPNIYIITGNLISIIAYIFIIIGAEGVYERDLGQTIFGV